PLNHLTILNSLEATGPFRQNQSTGRELISVRHSSMHRADLDSDSQWRFSDKILNLSSTDSDEGNGAWPRPPSGPTNRQRRQLRPQNRYHRKKFSTGSFHEGERFPGNEAAVELRFVKEEDGTRFRTKSRESEIFQQHILGLQQQSLQLVMLIDYK
ncbi:hypothetical protein BVRB_029670, partial [Beta vulgaris subsp. vulgaris]